MYVDPAAAAAEIHQSCKLYFKNNSTFLRSLG
jgi:hypothetical protein